MNFPILYYHNNIIINTSGRIFALYRFSGKPYNFLPNEEKESVIRNFEAFLWGLKGKGQILILNKEMDLSYSDYEKISGIPESLEFKNHANSVIKSLSYIGAREKVRYLCIEISTIEEGSVKSFFEEMRDSVLTPFLGIDKFSLSDKKLKKIEGAEDELYNKIWNVIDARADITDIEFIMRRNVDRINSFRLQPGVKKTGLFTPGVITSFTDNTVIKEHMSYIEVINSDGEKQYQILLSAPDIPAEISMLNSELIASLQQIGFPVDVAVNFDIMLPHQARKKAENKKEWLKQHIKEKYSGDEEASIDETEGYRSSNELIHKTSKGQPLYSISITVAVGSKELKEAKVRAQRIKEFYTSMGFRMERLAGDQLKLLYSMLPGTTAHTIKIQCDPGYLAALGSNVAFSVGDDEGLFIGYSNAQPVFWKPGFAARKKNASNAIFISGKLGSGKSFASKLLTYLSAVSGSYVFIIDPKNEYGSLGNLFPVERLDLSPFSDLQINPFMISNDLNRSKQIATDCLTLLLGADKQSSKYLAIAQAVEITCNKDESNRNMRTFLEELYKMNQAKQFGDEIANDSQYCARVLESIRQTGLGKKLFGTERLKIKHKFVIINLKGLPLPTTAQIKLESEYQGLALLYLASALIKEMVYSLPANELKCCVFDEAWMLLNIGEGRRIIEELIRMGARSLNAIPVLITQNTTDIKDFQTLKNNITYYFVFKTNDKDESEANLEMIGAEKSLLKVFGTLSTGECIMRDVYSRIGRMRFCACPDYLANVFNTTPD
jgi:hypothetical protein